MFLPTISSANHLVSAAARPRSSAVRCGSSSRCPSKHLRTCRAWRDDSQGAFEFFMNDFLKQWQQAAEDHRRLQAKHNMARSSSSQHCKPSSHSSCSSKHTHHSKPHTGSHHTCPEEHSQHHPPRTENNNHHQHQQQQQQRLADATQQYATASTTRTPCYSSSSSSVIQEEPQASAAAAAGASEGPSQPGGITDLLLPLDVVETAAAYVLYADVPGIESAEQLSIQLSQQQQSEEQQPQPAADAGESLQQQQQQQQVRHMMTISGRRKVPVGSSGVQSASTAAAAAAAGVEGAAVFSQQERNFKPFVRSWVLPDDASSEGITAQVVCGVLSITVAKTASSSRCGERHESDAAIDGDGGGSKGDGGSSTTNCMRPEKGVEE